MNPDALTAWLQACGLQHLARVLIDNGIDDDVLSCLAEPDLEKIGLSMGDRKRLLRAIASRESTPTPAPHRSHPATGELRQLTIMFCDLVDATALSERLTPEQWRAVVLAYQQTAVAIIEHHGGSVAQYLGDGLLVYFGYPQALEDAAERALRAGLSLVTAVAGLQWPDQGLSDLRLAVRMGVHTGTVVMGEIGAGRRREQLALGDVPNLAARLQAIAAPDTVVLSETTRTLAGGGFSYEDLGRHALKGIREPRQVWQVTGTTATGSRFDASLRVGLTPLIGRVHELALLMDRWDAARQGQGQVVMLGGEPGVGKSRMLKELRDRLGNAGLQAVALQCSPHAVHRAFHPFVDYIEQVLGWGPDVSAEGRLQQMRTVLLDHLQVDPVHFGPLAFLLSIPVSGEHAMPAGSASQHEQASMDALVAVMQALSRHAPLLGLIEDAHWADPSTLALLKQLVAATRQQPLLLLITHRPEFNASLDRHAHVTQLKMPGLREVEVLSMIEHLAADRPLSDAWLRHIVDKTDGIPLFVEELTRSILEAPTLPDRPASATGVPATLRDSLMARLERHPGSRELAEVGAAIGRDFSHALVSEVSDMSPVALEQAVAALIQSGLVTAQPSRQGTIYTFKHALVQDAAYDAMVQVRREALHREILRALENRTAGQPEPEPSLLARHAQAAGQRHMAVMRWRQASERALKRLSLHEAEAHLQSALGTLGELPASSQRDQTAMHLHALLGTVHMLGRGWGAPEVAQAYAQAHALANVVDKVEESIWPLWGVCVFHLVHGDVTRAEAIGRRMMTVARQSNSRVAWLVTNMMHTQLCFYAGRLTEVPGHTEQVDDRYSIAQDRQLIALYSSDLKLASSVHGAHARWILGETEDTPDLIRDCERHAAMLAHPYSLAWMLTWGSMSCLHRGDVDALWQRVNEGRRIAEVHGFAYVLSMATLMMGWCEVQRGRVDEGVTQMASGLAAFRATGAGIAVPYFQTLLAEALGQAGRWREGLALLQEAWAQTQQGGERWHEAELHRIRAVLLAQDPQADRRQVQDSLDKAATVARAQGALSWLRRAEADALALLGSPLKPV